MPVSRTACFRGVCLALFAAGLVGCRGDSSTTPTGGSTAGSGQSGEQGTKRIIILTNGSSPFWDAAAAGARDAAKDLKLDESGLTVVVDRNDFKVNGQIDKLKQYGNSTDVAAVGISVTDANNRVLAEEMRRLQDAGIKVVTIDSDLDRKTSRNARFAYLGTDNVIAGRELGKAAAALLPDGGEYATFVGLKGAANARERIGGFAEGAGDKFQQVENLDDGGDVNRARENVGDALNRHSDLDLLVGIWSYNTPAIVDIVKDRGVRDKVKVIGFDADPPTIKAMGEGNVDVMIVQNPYQMGYQGVRLLNALVKDDQNTIKEILPNRGEEDGDLYNTGLKIVVPSDQSPLNGGLFESNTEFLTLDQFQAWLKKYNLTGS